MDEYADKELKDILGKRYKFRNDYSESDGGSSDMEAGYDSIEEEEKRSRRLA